uniref:Uncharacterized protein n=1 Tax=Junco hyemalis TaxID=40217 RepID=A0A8C5NI76_JUNHY
MPIPPPPPPPPGPPPPPTLSQVGVTCAHRGHFPLERAACGRAGVLWEVGMPSWAVPVLGGNPGEVLSLCSSPGEHGTAEAEPRGAAGPRGPPAGHL